MPIPMLNAINWNQGIDQVNKGEDTIFKGSQLVGGALTNAANARQQDTQNGQKMFMDGLKFYADYDQKEDQARRDNARLDMDKVKFNQDQDYNAKMNPLRISTAEENLKQGRLDNDYANWTRDVEIEKQERSEEVRTTAEQATINRWEKANPAAKAASYATPMQSIKETKELAASPTNRPSNWDQMSSTAKSAWIKQNEVITSEEQSAKGLSAEISSKEAKASTDEVAATYAPSKARLDIEKGRSDLQSAEVSRANMRVQTEKGKVDLAEAGLKAAATAGQQKNFDQAQSSGGKTLFIAPDEKVAQELAKRQGVNLDAAQKKSEEFAQKNGVVSEIRKIAFKGEKPQGKEGTYTSAQLDNAAAYIHDRSFINTSASKSLTSLEQQYVLANKDKLGGGSMSDFDAARLEKISGGTASQSDYSDYVNWRKRLYGDAEFRSFINRTSADESKDRAAVAATLGDDLTYVDPSRVSGVMRNMAGDAGKDAKFGSMSIEEQGKKAFGVTVQPKGDGSSTMVDTPNWKASQGTSAKYKQYDDFRSGDTSRTDAYRPAEEAERFNPFSGVSDTAARAFDSQQRRNTMKNNPPQNSQAYRHQNNTIASPGAHGGLLFSSDANLDSYPLASTVSGQPVLATPRPVQAQEKMRGYGYPNPEKAQSRYDSAFQ